MSALEVSERDIDTFIPTSMDMGVAEALLAGCFTSVDIAAFLQTTPSRVWGTLKNPVAAAWVSRQLQSHVKHRLGMVLSSMFARAVGGDVGAAKLLLDRFGQIQSLSHVIHHKGLDVTKLSDADLDMVINGKLHETSTVIQPPVCEDQRMAPEEPGKVCSAGAAYAPTTETECSEAPWREVQGLSGDEPDGSSNRPCE